MKQPQKRNKTSFAVAPGDEPKGRMMGFRPPQSLEIQIVEAVKNSGLSMAEWLRDAAIAYLQKNPLELARGEGLEQGQLGSGRGTEDAIATEPTLNTGDGEQAPATGDITVGEDQARNARTKSKRKTSPRSRAKAGEAAGTGSRRKQTRRAG